MAKTVATPDDVTALREMVVKQNEYIKDLQDSATTYGTVIGEDGEGFLSVATGSSLVRVHRNEDDLKVGDEVQLIPETKQIIGRSIRRRNGSTVSLHREVTEGRWEIDMDGTGSRIIMLSERLHRAPKEGDLAVVDPTGTVVVELLSRPETTEYGFDSTRVTWDMIGGHEDAKSELREAVALLRGGNKLYEMYGATAPKGFLFFGEPGNGKTMLGKAMATELSSDGPGSFMYVKGPEILNKYVGTSEARVRGIFAAAKDHKARTGRPSIVFIDEADAILQRRGSGISSDMEKTIVTSFLTEMDGLETSAALVILSTNRPDTLDEAVIRDGRIDRRIHIGRPGFDQIKEIFVLNLRGAPINKEQTVDLLAETATETLVQPGPLAERLSGALIVAVVERAKRRAIRRDLANKAKVASGLCREDLTQAIIEINAE